MIVLWWTPELQGDVHEPVSDTDELFRLAVWQSLEWRDPDGLE
jgi:hypothetical protein